MADIDVSAQGLAAPPVQAPVTAYRPSIAVMNRGLAPASVSGWVSVYDRATGLLIKTFPLSASSIPPGQTRNAASSLYWTPEAGDIGKHFLFTGFVTTPRDQVPGNNNLAPVDVLIVEGEPPGPQPVEDHASQHENGGGDEVNVDGLPGRLAEDQDPTDHVSSHELGGTDEIDVDGLTGALVTPQTPKAHHDTHEPGGVDPISGIAPSPHVAAHESTGDDELNVQGLFGVLAAGQNPIQHASSHQHNADDELNVDGLSGVLGTQQVPSAHKDRHQLAGDDALTGLLYDHPSLHNAIGSLVSIVDPGFTIISQYEINFPAPVCKALILVSAELSLPPASPSGASGLMRTKVNGELSNYVCRVSQSSQEAYVVSLASVMDFRVLNTAAISWTIEVLCELVDLPYSATLIAFHVIPLG